MGEIPHLKAAVSWLKDQPFEILTVSLDDTVAEAVEMVKTMDIPGVHTWNGEGDNNPVVDLYNVQGLPTWYLIDDKGVIRARDPLGDRLIPALKSVLGPIKDASTDTKNVHEG